jgi:hypothetical protein
MEQGLLGLHHFINSSRQRPQHCHRLLIPRQRQENMYIASNSDEGESEENKNWHVVKNQYIIP